ncbi:CDK5 and ABL1 enzyme substrate 2 [Gastrophryne carolinensis]
MAAATCGSPGGVAGPGELPQRRKRGSDSRRRQAALFFLNNISLDGRPVCPLPPTPGTWENGDCCPEPLPAASPNGPRIVLPQDTPLPETFTPAAARSVPPLTLLTGGLSVERSRKKSRRCPLCDAKLSDSYVKPLCQTFTDKLVNKEHNGDLMRMMKELKDQISSSPMTQRAPESAGNQVVFSHPTLFSGQLGKPSFFATQESFIPEDESEEGEISFPEEEEDDQASGSSTATKNRYLFPPGDLPFLLHMIYLAMGIEEKVADPKSKHVGFYPDLASDSSYSFPFHDYLKDMILEEWKDPSKKVFRSRGLKRRYPFSKEGSHLWEKCPKLDAPFAKISKGAGLAFEDFGVLNDPLDKKMDSLLKKAWEVESLVFPDRIVMKVDPCYLPKVASDFHRTQEIIIPSITQEDSDLIALKVRSQLLQYLQQTKDFRKADSLFISFSGPRRGLRVSKTTRRHASHRYSLEFLDDFTEFIPVSRSKHAPESPRHLKKTHFIKSMRHYDTRNSRIVLICAKRSLCTAFSILPYGESQRISELRVEGSKQRHSSGGAVSCHDPVFSMEGVELGAEGEVVSYAKYLYPTNALVSQKDEGQGRLGFHEVSKRNIRFMPVPSGIDMGGEVDCFEYNPDILDDPQWPCGKHKRVLIFASYMTTVIEYVKPSDLKKDMNEMFKEKFPHVKLTLSKIRSLKREMRNVAEECSLEPVTVAMSFVYFEKLVLQGRVNKQNRKLCAGACVLLAAKISSDFKKPELKHLLDKLEERFRANRRDLVAFELTVLVAMELALYLPEAQVLPHFRRLTKQQ